MYKKNAVSVKWLVSTTEETIIGDRHPTIMILQISFFCENTYTANIKRRIKF